jgi:hypothetical protein
MKIERLFEKEGEDRDICCFGTDVYFDGDFKIKAIKNLEEGVFLIILV